MAIPPELFEYRQWVLWRRTEVNGRMSKIPISAWSGKAAACDKPQTWSTYCHVRHVVRRFRCDGIGFVFTDCDPFCGIDLDQCRPANGNISPEALDLVRRMGSYTELSPSGTGVHILLKGGLREKGRRVGKVEIYHTGRYFTVTGKQISGTPFEIRSRQEMLDQLMAELVSPADPASMRAIFARPNASDQELIERALRARSGDRFGRLWAGNPSDYENDHSRADMALCRMLAFWTGGDRERIDRLFRLSGLMREKWDRRTGDVTYGALTILSLFRQKSSELMLSTPGKGLPEHSRSEVETQT